MSLPCSLPASLNMLLGAQLGADENSFTGTPVSPTTLQILREPGQPGVKCTMSGGPTPNPTPASVLPPMFIPLQTEIGYVDLS